MGLLILLSWKTSLSLYGDVIRPRVMWDHLPLVDGYGFGVLQAGLTSSLNTATLHGSPIGSSVDEALSGSSQP